MSAAAIPTREAPHAEHRETFACFGSECTVIVADAHRTADAGAATATAKRRLLEWHERFSRFHSDSELSRFNVDPRPVVPVSPMLRTVIEAGVGAARTTGGVVDPTLGCEIEQAGYDRHLAHAGVPLRTALALGPERAPAGPSSSASWRQIKVDRRAGTVSRPPGVKLDAGGIAKGVFADELAALLSRYDAFVVDCAGDIRLGGGGAIPREVHVASPFDDRVLHTFVLAEGAFATSGIGRRSWFLSDGRPAHHLLDARTGRPAFTGVVQATAFAPTAAEAEVLSKAAVLSGPQAAGKWLTDGGLVVLDDGSYAVTPTRVASHAHMSSSTRSCSGSFRISW
jgi:FAD:protein FMN transferase